MPNLPIFKRKPMNLDVPGIVGILIIVLGYFFL
jgi:hypothetical protein